MKKTDNYKLNKPEENDYINIKDLNENADTVDKELQDRVEKEKGKGLSTNDYTDAEQQKLYGIEQGANNYNHPDTHPASMITESKQKNFVSQSEKDDWNAKETPTGAQQKVDKHANKQVSNSEIHGLRVNDNGELEFNDGDEWKHATYRYIIPDDPTESPGAKRLISGDMNAGFYDEVPSSELFTGSELASEVGITEGTPHNDYVPWIKYSYKGKTCFRPKKSIRYGISWDEINNNGCVDGTTTVQKNGMKFKVRLMSGATQDPASDSGDRDAPGSEWNQIMLPISEKAIDDSWEHPDYVGSDVPVWKHGFGNGTDGMYTDDDLGFVSGGGHRHWCQEHSQNGSSKRVRRGLSSGPSIAGWSRSHFTHARLGWAPCLEIIE